MAGEATRSTACHQIRNRAIANWASDRHQVNVASPVVITAQRQGPGRVDAGELLAERADDAFCHGGQIPLFGRRQPSQHLERSSGHGPASWQRCAASVRVSAAWGSAPARLAFFASNARVHSPAAQAAPIS